MAYSIIPKSSQDLYMQYTGRGPQYMIGWGKKQVVQTLLLPLCFVLNKFYVKHCLRIHFPWGMNVSDFIGKEQGKKGEREDD